ncbi:MAG: hypothetical protein Q9M91_01080 [Candidatus Dojkabacteria bacterium]|nr:hypothetical protein [Candidatus Dojkabacteria bacterium]MDQ7020420.1 hypothetical protein [Candidatus Dojkabacteria bacterium]
MKKNGNLAITNHSDMRFMLTECINEYKKSGFPKTAGELDNMQTRVALISFNNLVD